MANVICAVGQMSHGEVDSSCVPLFILLFYREIYRKGGVDGGGSGGGIGSDSGGGVDGSVGGNGGVGIGGNGGGVDGGVGGNGATWSGIESNRGSLGYETSLSKRTQERRYDSADEICLVIRTHSRPEKYWRRCRRSQREPPGRYSMASEGGGPDLYQKRSQSYHSRLRDISMDVKVDTSFGFEFLQLLLL
ncbi:hypothetical protein F4860DRAFT_509079 [Xylaria cubensis]|nr:hypothetical protein F4860DRAFT_509079 [Xylaria cubensis]